VLAEIDGAHPARADLAHHAIRAEIRSDAHGGRITV
jgi:hypothetical protein